MRVLTLSGSTRPASSNARLLQALTLLAQEHPKTFTFVEGPNLGHLPLFTTEALAEEQARAFPKRYEAVATLRHELARADAVVIATPEYAHNLPASLKSAFEWVVASGEFSRKRTVAITATPHAPRGERCMQSLVWTLQALDATVLAEVPLYNVAAGLSLAGHATEAELVDMLTAILDLLLE